MIGTRLWSCIASGVSTTVANISTQKSLAFTKSARGSCRVPRCFTSTKLVRIGFWWPQGTSAISEFFGGKLRSMRVFLLGATGALGTHLVPQLISQRHTVTGTTRSPAKANKLIEQGAQAAVLDALDREALIEAVQRAQPEVLIHQLTAIPPRLDMRHFDREFQSTNRLRTEGTDNAVAAALRAGVRRVIAQSFAGWTYAREGGRIKTEEDPFDPAPPAQFRRTLKAIQYLEQAVGGERGVEGIILRYGAFYGPKTSLARNGTHVEDVRQRKFPRVGNGQGVWSFIHIADAAAATVAAVERGVQVSTT